MSAQNREEHAIKVVLLSEPGTGAKTSLATRFVYDVFEEKTVSTLVVSLFKKTVTVGGTEVALTIWGLERRQHTDTHTKQTKGRAP